MPKQLFARISDEPLLVDANRADWLAMTLSALAEHSDYKKLMSAEHMAVEDDYWPEEGSWMSNFKPYNVRDGILQIPVRGMLLHGFNYQFFDYATGYNYIVKVVERGMSDFNVTGIAFVIDSNGGEVAGNFDLVDRIYSFRGTKPMEAFVNESAYSAAYSIASACDKIHVTRTAGVGSVGVVTSHVSYAKYMEKAGIEVTFIYAGARKVDGNAYEKLSPEVRERIQSRIDSMYDIFTGTVARNRGMTVEAVKSTEAMCYTGEDAIAVGFADSINTFSDALQLFSNKVNQRSGDNMTTATNKPEASAAEGQGKDTASVDVAAERATAFAAGATAERTRIKAIVGCNEATGREALANHLAFGTDMTAEAAAGILAASPAAAAAAPTKDQAAAFAEAMSNTPNPDIKGDGKDSADAQEQDAVATIVGDWGKATGRGTRK